MTSDILSKKFRIEVVFDPESRQVFYCYRNDATGEEVKVTLEGCKNLPDSHDFDMLISLVPEGVEALLSACKGKLKQGNNER